MMVMFMCKLPHQLIYVVQAVMLQNTGKELLKLKNKVRFILAVISGDIIANNRKRAELFLELKQKGYEPFPKRKNTAKEVDEENDYEYLLAMPIGTLTLEKVQELVARQKKLEDELESLGKATPEILWMRDLAALENELDVIKQCLSLIFSSMLCALLLITN
mgnify:CR=1 FL=1